MRVFLTGVSGYLGGLLAAHLAQVPDVESITGIDIAAPRMPLPPKVQFRQADIRSETLSQVMAGHEIIVHTAFIVQWRAKMSEAERCDVNLNGITNLGKAAVESRAQRFIHTSSVAAYDPAAVTGRSGVTEEAPIGTGKTPSYYANDKALAELRLTQALAGSSVTATMLRPSYIIGNRNAGTVAYLRRLRDGPLDAVRYPGRDPRQQYVHEDDVLAAFEAAVQHDLPGAYNVVPDDWLRWTEVLKTLGRKSVPTVPLWAARLWTTTAWRLLNSPLHPSWVDVSLADVTFDNTKLKATGLWHPRYTTAGTLRSAIHESELK